MIKLFFPAHLFDPATRKEWLEIVRSKDRYENRNSANDSVLQKELEWINEPDDADVLLLPMDWEYYYKRKREDEAIQWVNEWKEKKPVLSQSSGDYAITGPDKVWQLRQNIYASRNNKYQIAYPTFFEDPLSRIFDAKEITVNEYKEIPTVGFCGQSLKSPQKVVADTIRTIIRNVRSNIGMRFYDTHNLVSSSYLREKVLGVIENSELQTNFIRRKKYRAGASTEEERRETTVEYFKNQEESDYIVCVRGGGNFSVRFYETLAMGRVPIFINTDCKLPFHHDIEWNNHVVWIEQNEINKIPEKVFAFHEQLGIDGFLNIQESNRKLWEEKLTMSSFFLQTIRNIIHEQ